jgi:hypothetical protein
MGSIYYYDFILFHKYLGIDDMISIDSENCEKRFLFNLPYDFVRFENKKTTEFIKKFHFEKNVIIWFDHDSTLIRHNRIDNLYEIRPSILEDLKIIAKSANRNDFFIITINYRFPKELMTDKNQKIRFVENFSEFLSDEYQNDKMIIEKYYSKIIQNVICNIIKNAETFSEVKFRKLFSFTYSDGAPMYTIGGIFTDFDDISKKINGGKFICFDEDRITDIDVPLLTYREKLALDSKILELERQFNELTEDKIIEILNFEIGKPELKHYLEYYKYYPQYYEGIF